MHISKSAVIGRSTIWRMKSGSRPPARYAAWSIEELRVLACQLQLRDANGKTRRELLEILAGHPGE